MVNFSTAAQHSPALNWRQIWHHPMPYQAHSPLNRAMARIFIGLCRSYLTGVTGSEHIQPARDPFILVLNHNQKLEALLVPTLLVYLRGGKIVHFLSDWNFRLIPFVSFFLRRAETIVLMNKPARPRFLNILKPLYTPRISGFERARLKLEEGGAIGIYPEGTINRHPTQLLKGHTGAARLSLETGIPIVPAGIRFPGHSPQQPIREWIPMEIEIGSPLTPSVRTVEPSLSQVREWHAVIMREIARLSRKDWVLHTARRRL